MAFVELEVKFRLCGILRSEEDRQWPLRRRGEHLHLLPWEALPP